MGLGVGWGGDRRSSGAVGRRVSATFWRTPPQPLGVQGWGGPGPSPPVVGSELKLSIFLLYSGPPPS